LTASFSYYQSASSEKIMEGFKKMIPLKTYVIRDGKKKKVNVSQITVGDLGY
jgi:magnesium-transporting ATPase (P-type)